jgi:integral membrane protein
VARPGFRRRVPLPLNSSVGRLRIVGFLEGVSFLLLLGIAMPLKYMANRPEAVSVVGMAHGVLFLLYLAAAIQAALEHDWTWRKPALLFLAALLPFGPFVADAKLLRAQES